MSDVMLLGVLRMPPELWTGEALDVMQRHGRYTEAADRIAADADRIAALETALAEARQSIVGWNDLEFGNKSPGEFLSTTDAELLARIDTLLGRKP